MTRITAKSVKGTELAVGDTRYYGWEDERVIVEAASGRLAAGARYQDITYADGETERCWEGFLYRIRHEYAESLI